MVKCNVENCNKEVYVKGYCQFHYNRNYIYGNPLRERIISKNGRYPCSVCGSPSHAHKLCSKHIIEEQKMKVFNYYTNGLMMCNCCGEKIIKFLAVDHINNDGYQHRQSELSLKGGNMYRWLVKNNFPKGFQILCMNCNWGKHVNNGVCPHKI